MTNPHLLILVFRRERELYSGFGMKSALTERATEPWPKGVHSKEAEVRKDAKLSEYVWFGAFRGLV
jgi:hypothetical protein